MKSWRRRSRVVVVLCIITDFSERRQLLPARYQRAYKSKDLKKEKDE